MRNIVAVLFFGFAMFVLGASVCHAMITPWSIGDSRLDVVPQVKTRVPWTHTALIDDRGTVDSLNKSIVRLGASPLWVHGGSGIVLGGHFILTARHVVENIPLYVQYYGDPASQYEADGLSRDAWGEPNGLDVGLLWVKREGGTPVTIDCAPVWSGQRVLLIGHPTLLPWYSAFGHVASATPNEYDMVALDIPVAPGDSGGGVFNEQGKLVGVLNAQLNGTGYSYMIPASKFCGVIKKASNGAAIEISAEAKP